MALPTLEKTWEFDINNLVGGLGSGSNDNGDVIVKIKDILIGFASGYWSLSASSDGSTADTNDNWVDYTDIIFNSAGNAHSWCVLTNSATGFQICIDATGTGLSPASLTKVYFSPGGNYALGGVLSNTNRPTAADEMGISTAGYYGGVNNSFSGYLHALCSDDGECTRVVMCLNSSNYLFWVLDKLKDPMEPLVGSWDTPFVAIATGDGSDFPNFADLNDTARFKGLGVSEFSAYATCETYAGQLACERLTTANSMSNAWVMCPIGMVSENTLNLGRKGTLYDIWYGSVTINTGDTYPGDGSYQFVQFAGIILPWNGVAPLITI